MAVERTEGPQVMERQWLQACGSTVDGELGLGGTEESIIRGVFHSKFANTPPWHVYIH